MKAQTFERAPVWQRALITVVAEYEVFAIWGHRHPTITRLVDRKPVLGGVIVGVLVWHFISDKETRRRQ